MSFFISSRLNFNTSIIFIILNFTTFAISHLHLTNKANLRQGYLPPVVRVRSFVNT
nr:MAG TPA: Cas system-associated protein [Caudoviricetes sp.]